MTGTAATRVEEFPAADIFLETELKPAADGSYAVPGRADGQAASVCDGMKCGRSRRLELHWADAASVPSAEAVQVQYWVGISPWQGQWKPLAARLELAPGVWSWQIAPKDQPAGTYRVRWVFPASRRPIAIKKVSAFSRSSWVTAQLRAELQPAAGKQAGLPSPASGRGAGGEGGATVSSDSTALTLVLSQRERGHRVVITNGNLLGSAGQNTALAAVWDVSRPLHLKVRYSEAGSHKGDRTVLRFELPGQPISVAVEDVVAKDACTFPAPGCL